jgi:hypothetical protein
METNLISKVSMYYFRERDNFLFSFEFLESLFKQINCFCALIKSKALLAIGEEYLLLLTLIGCLCHANQQEF